MDFSEINFIADLKAKKLPEVLAFIEQDDFYGTYLISDTIGFEAVIKLCREMDPSVRKVAVAISSKANADVLLTQAKPYAIETADRTVVAKHTGSTLFLIPPLESEIEHRWFKNQNPHNICMDSVESIRRDRRAVLVEPSSFMMQFAALNGFRFVQATGLEKDNKELVHFRTWLKKHKKEIETIKFK